MNDQAALPHQFTCRHLVQEIHAFTPRTFDNMGIGPEMMDLRLPLQKMPEEVIRAEDTDHRSLVIQNGDDTDLTDPNRVPTVPQIAYRLV